MVACNEKKIEQTQPITTITTETSSPKAETTAFQIAKGKIILGLEGDSFRPCGNDKVFYVIDKTGTLEKNYNELIEDKPKFTSVYAEVEVVEKPSSSQPYAFDYAGIYEITKFLSIRNSTEDDCK